MDRIPKIYFENFDYIDAFSRIHMPLSRSLLASLSFLLLRRSSEAGGKGASIEKFGFAFFFLPANTASSTVIASARALRAFPLAWSPGFARTSLRNYILQDEC